jgi:phosphoenolpyruvate carboxykinase (GTP)
MGSEMTAAAVGGLGQVRRDPMAMLPFCGYNMGRYFQHWLKIGPRLKNPPLIFHVNWFRKNADGKFLWPGFGENMRVLKWIIDRVNGRGNAAETEIGLIPRPEDFDLDDLDVPRETMRELFSIKPEEWTKELDGQSEFFKTLGQDMPPELIAQRDQLAAKFAK